MNETEQFKKAMAIHAEFIALGLIEQHEGGWRLTDKGVIEADRTLSNLSQRDKALVMLRTALIINEGKHEQD